MKPRIGDKFSKAAAIENPLYKGVHPRAVIIARSLYDSYLEQFNLSRRLARHLEKVMADREHVRIMEEGRVLRYKLPDEEAFIAELELYRDFLNRFDPKEVTILGDGRVQVPLRTALHLHYMGEYNRELVEHVLLAVLRTEYLRRFTDLKRRGIPYEGPTALQETMDVLLACHRTGEEEKISRRLNDWPRLDP